MDTSQLVLIAALAENRIIGKNGKIPWHLPEDLSRFKKLTIGHSVIMGRKTYESIPLKFRPLPERNNIVITSNNGFDGHSVIRAGSVDEALQRAKFYGKKIFIIGGEQIYRQTIDLADRLELTEVRGEFDGDSYFPEYKNGVWREVNRIPRGSYDFVSYKRRSERPK